MTAHFTHKKLSSVTLNILKIKLLANCINLINKIVHFTSSVNICIQIQVDAEMVKTLLMVFYIANNGFKTE